MILSMSILLLRLKTLERIHALKSADQGILRRTPTDRHGRSRELGLFALHPLISDVDVNHRKTSFECVPHLNAMHHSDVNSGQNLPNATHPTHNGSLGVSLNATHLMLHAS